MARTEAVVPGGVRLPDYLGAGVIAKVVPLAVVQVACGSASGGGPCLPRQSSTT